VYFALLSCFVSTLMARSCAQVAVELPGIPPAVNATWTDIIQDNLPNATIASSSFTVTLNAGYVADVCGDGLCSEVEAASSLACPQDCPAATSACPGSTVESSADGLNEARTAQYIPVFDYEGKLGVPQVRCAYLQAVVLTRRGMDPFDWTCSSSK
jgi:hypothetical protein